MSDLGPPALSPYRRSCAQDFYVLKKSIDLSRISIRELGFRGEHVTLRPPRQTMLNLQTYLPLPFLPLSVVKISFFSCAIMDYSCGPHTRTHARTHTYIYTKMKVAKRVCYTIYNSRTAIPMLMIFIFWIRLRPQ